MKILLVEDEELIAKNIKVLLKRRGIAVDVAENIEEGYVKTIDEDYDCIILDRGLPDGDGISLIQKIRDEKIIVPVLVLTAKGENEDVAFGLNIGADDYLAKPFDIEVLTARIKALIRRGDKIPNSPVIIVGDLEINTSMASVLIGGKIIDLSPKEYSILEYLALNPNKVIDRLTLLTHAWGEEVDLFSNTVDVHIKYLRNKIGNITIKTVRGKGYMLNTK